MYIYDLAIDIGLWFVCLTIAGYSVFCFACSSGLPRYVFIYVEVQVSSIHDALGMGLVYRLHIRATCRGWFAAVAGCGAAAVIRVI